VREQVLKDPDLFAADECFLTSTTREVVPIVQVDDRAIGSGTPGPVAKALLDGFRRKAKVLAAPAIATRLFQLMTRRYEHASTVLMSDKGFEEWGEILGDDVMAAALIDRLVHHCHLVTIRGDSQGITCVQTGIPHLRPATIQPAADASEVLERSMLKYMDPHGSCLSRVNDRASAAAAPCAGCVTSARRRRLQALVSWPDSQTVRSFQRPNSR
jgi:hypothetical protein